MNSQEKGHCSLYTLLVIITIITFVTILTVTSGQCILTKGCIATAHGWYSLYYNGPPLTLKITPSHGGIVDSSGPKEPCVTLAANTIEPSMCGGDADFC